MAITCCWSPLALTDRNNFVAILSNINANEATLPTLILPLTRKITLAFLDKDHSYPFHCKCCGKFVVGDRANDAITLYTKVCYDVEVFPLCVPCAELVPDNADYQQPSAVQVIPTGDRNDHAEEEPEPSSTSPAASRSRSRSR